MPSILADVKELAKCRITLKEWPRECTWKLQKIRRELKRTSGAVLEAHCLALSKAKKAWLCRQQLESDETQLDSALEKVICAEMASAEAAVRIEGKLAHLQKDSDLSRQRTAADKCSLTDLHECLL